MPLQRRLPKVGFASRKSRFSDEVRLGALVKVEGDIIDLQTLKAAGLVDARALKVKVIARGEIDRAVSVSGVGVTKGARAAIEAAGGKVEEA
jgi:large subunit ribosomal protein L15